MAATCELLLETGYEGLPINGEPPPDTGDLRTDLHTWLTRQFEALADPYVLSLIRAITAAAADNDAAGAALYERFTGPAHEALVTRLAAGEAAGQVRSGADLHAAADAVAGTLVYVALTPQDPSPGQRIAGCWTCSCTASAGSQRLPDPALMVAPHRLDPDQRAEFRFRTTRALFESASRRYRCRSAA